MASSAAHPELIAHPLRTAALQEKIDCTVWARFRTFDRTLDPYNDPYRPLAKARVELVCSNGTLIVAGETDNDGELFASGSTTVRLVVPDVQDLAAFDFHFVVLGPKGSSADLTAMTYKVGSAAESFPVAQWSTRGWQEPEGHWGNFKLSRPAFPLDQSDPDQRAFTVGCYICPYLTYQRSSGETGFYPENMHLALVRNNSIVTPLAPPIDGQLCMTFFDVVPEDTVELRAYFQANAISGDQITPVNGKFTIWNAPTPFAPGETIGHPAINCAHQIRLFGDQLPLLPATFLPASIMTYATGTKISKIQYKAAQVNLNKRYNNLHVDEKIAVAINWFVEFIAFRNLYMRAMKVLLSKSAKITWAGLVELDLNIDDIAGGAFATNQSSTKKSITAHLEYLLKPREDTALHELSHTFVYQYLNTLYARIYFPKFTSEHNFVSYSNEFFAFSEGFPQFLASLFMDPELAYLLASTWPDLFKFQPPPATPTSSPVDLLFGYSMTAVPTNLLEPGVGLVSETAFAAALTKLWIGEIWTGSGTHTWIVDMIGNGDLDTASSTAPNHWLLDSKVAERFSLLIDAVASSPLVEGRTSTRRIIDELEKATTASTSWPWTAIKPSLDHFRVANEFFISSIQGPIGNACVVARSSATALAYGTYQATIASGQDNFARLKKTGGTITLRGIRMPTGSASGFAAKLKRGTAQIAAQVAAISEYEATAAFTGAALGAASGLYDLEVTDGSQTIKIVNAVKVVP